MSRPILDLVRDRIADRLAEARRSPLLGSIGVWLGVLEQAPVWTPPDGLRRYVDVAEAGAVVAATGADSTRAFFNEGIAWLQRRRFFVPGQPPGLEADPVAVVALAIGLTGVGAGEEPKKWLVGLASRALTGEVGSQRADLLRLASALVQSDEASWRSVSPLLRVALATKSKTTPTQSHRQAALAALLSTEQLEPEWAVFHEAALRSLFAMEAAIDLAHPTVEQVVGLLGRIPAALKRWPWEEKSKTQHKDVTAQRWGIHHEYHVQSLIWTVLRPVFPGLEDEENLPSLGHKHPRADLLLPGLRLIIEVKYLREATQSARAKIIEEVAADTGLYLSGDSAYDSIIAFVWDATGSTHQHDELAAGLRKLRGVIDAIIVSRPGEWKLGPGSAP